MPSQIYLIRHGQSTFNSLFDADGIDPLHFDAPLSATGHGQVREVRKTLATLPKPDLVICSPLTRAIETALGLFGDTGVPIEVTDIHRERLENSCDVGSSPADLAAAFPTLRFDHLDDPWWHRGDPDVRGVCVEPHSLFADRVEQFARWLGAADRGVVMVVGHGAFFRLLTGRHFANCEIVHWETAT